MLEGVDSAVVQGGVEQDRQVPGGERPGLEEGGGDRLSQDAEGSDPRGSGWARTSSGAATPISTAWVTMWRKKERSAMSLAAPLKARMVSVQPIAKAARRPRLALGPRA